MRKSEELETLHVKVSKKKRDTFIGKEWDEEILGELKEVIQIVREDKGWSGHDFALAYPKIWEFYLSLETSGKELKS